ncbi:chemotaxis protein CheW [Gracilibacillus thailandensis]|jgi:purine-binding chemotaxis protein CheW|uniref:Chemotaxis protein CheW n=1 Tax=Gracilibacillus thailandensis TaxID=563735 RepID=A0A6N7R4T0_9BACI|nr:chemotaxis protein CheW [Gracilibacillus thailandensis]MRI68204.1 chemotaxis protein CheW [Gracilibacillus thailandensis]
MESLITKTIIFKLKNQEYGANIDQIRSIERLEEIVSLPQTSDFIKGIINLRGSVTPIIDLRTRLGMEEAEPTEQTRVLIANVREVQVGLIVDEATDVIDISPEVVEDAPELVKGVDYQYIKGVAKLEDRGMLLLLDLDYVLSVDEINEVQQVVDE